MEALVTTEGCTSSEDCKTCTALNCTWTGRVYRPCKISVADMEEVPIVLIRNQSDCPSFWGNNTLEVGGGETEGIDVLSWVLGVTVVLGILLLACFCLFRKVFKGNKTESMMELNELRP